MVMSLSSKYGMGKTTFIDCWRQELKNKDIKTIKFNAWESDFSGDAFAAFIAAFQNEFSNDSEAGEKFKTMSKKVGLSLLKSAPNLLTKIAVRKLTGESIDNFLKDIETDDDEVSSLFGDAVSAMFNGHIEATNAIESFKDEFANFIQEKCGGKLIIFIDELDRCRPAYAVEVLERIKHLFSVKGTIFVLGVDRQQLLNSISGVYGVNLDSEGYIRKFIDWDYELREPNYYQYCSQLLSATFQFQEKIHLFQRQDYHNGEVTFVEAISTLSENKKVSLRELEQYFTKLYLLIQGGNIKRLGFVPISIQLFLKLFHPEEYSETTNGIFKGLYRKDNLVGILIKSIFELEKINWSTGAYGKIMTTQLLITLLSENSTSLEKAQLCISEELGNDIGEEIDDERHSYDSIMNLIVKKHHSGNLYSSRTRLNIDLRP